MATDLFRFAARDLAIGEGVVEIVESPASEGVQRRVFVLDTGEKDEPVGTTFSIHEFGPVSDDQISVMDLTCRQGEADEAGNKNDITREILGGVRGDREIGVETGLSEAALPGAGHAQSVKARRNLVSMENHLAATLVETDIVDSDQATIAILDDAGSFEGAIRVGGRADGEEGESVLIEKGPHFFIRAGLLRELNKWGVIDRWIAGSGILGRGWSGGHEKDDGKKTAHGRLLRVHKGGGDGYL